MKAILQKYAEGGRVDVMSLTDDNRFWAIAKALMPRGSSGSTESRTVDIALPLQFRRPLLAIDPGETTGIAVYDPSSKAILLCQLETKELKSGFDKINGIIQYLACDTPSLEHVRYEDYRVYGHMTEQHSFASLRNIP